jgi:hypothetical protein
VRDLAEWIVQMVEKKATGAYNANGPAGEVSMERLLSEARLASNSNASFTWADEAFLLQERVAPWSELPLWLPDEAAPNLQGFMFVNSDKAVAAGLRYRSLSTTVSDTLSWYRTERAGSALAAGIERDREQALLDKWHDAK